MYLDRAERTEQHMEDTGNFGHISLAAGTLNNSVEKITENIKTNIRRGLPQLMRYAEHPSPIALVAGGPSLNDPESIKDLREHADTGYPVVALNGSAAWLEDHNIPYHSHVLLDSRPWNKRFVDSPKKGVKYFVCSQCDPSVFDALEGYEVYIWHGGTCKFCPGDMTEVYGDKYIKVRTGRTVVLGALYIFRTLGYSKYEIFGFDSCLMDGDIHHAYHQPENDMETIAEFNINDRDFRAHPWMIGQAQDFLKFSEILGHQYDISLHGDGLITWLVKSVAERGDLKYTDAHSLDRVISKLVSE